MRNRFLSILLTVVMLLGMTACGSKPEVAETPAPTVENEAKEEVAEETAE